MLQTEFSSHQKKDYTKTKQAITILIVNLKLCKGWIYFCKYETLVNMFLNLVSLTSNKKLLNNCINYNHVDVYI